MSFFVVFCSDLTQEQKENLAYWIRVLSANTVDPESLFVIQDDETTIKNLEQKFAKEIEQKNYIFKGYEIEKQDIKTPEQILIKKKTKEQNQRKRYIQNQINKTYQKHKKICFNKTKHK